MNKIKKTKVICIEGASASSRKDNTLGDFVNNILKDEAYDFRLLPSLFNCLDGLIRKESIYRSNIMIVAKSLGAIKLWWKLYQNDRELLNIEHYKDKLSIVLIDPHGPILGDGKMQSYGYGRNDNIEYKKSWTDKEIRIHCMYQRNEYPKGACFKDDRYNTKLQYANHFDITDADTIDGQIVATKIREEFECLKKK